MRSFLSGIGSIRKGRLAIRLTAMVVLALVLFPSLGYTSVSITRDLCCSGDDELACYCCLHEGAQSKGESPCFSHSCRASHQGDPFVWLQGETGIITEWDERVCLVKNEPVRISTLLSVPLLHAVIEKPPA